MFDENKFRELLTAVIRQEVKSALQSELKKALRKEYLTNDELRRMTGFSHRKLHYLRDKGQIGYIQHGRKILYRADDVDRFLQSQYIKPREIDDD